MEIPPGIKKARSHLSHTRMVDSIVRDFKRKGYKVYKGGYHHELEKILGKEKVDRYFNQEEKGESKNLYPDVVAIKDKEVIFIEAKDRSVKFVKQLANYTKLASKVILVVEVEDGDLEIRSMPPSRYQTSHK